ncbi:hypothetical protein LAZ67_21000950 [Cordylochernes scorpioides]|uniref:Mos1 transposase HTH domain-containing protein n=1 Tax=Cordylochernes scorpioides TaxID=51811 RepID=A0ABY6LML4_9ARAC|nr:hypothetical protein LAZ67_21000950 [Cordylochernes scorpioides]
MERSLEQRYAIKFCVRLGKNATETFHMLQKPFKDDCISRSQFGKWHKAFKEGREEVADEPRSGRPTTARTDENVDRVLEVLRTDRRLSIQQIADTLHMSTFVEHVTEDLQMRKVCAKLVPKVLTQDQKELRVLRCQELLDLVQNEPDFLNSVITGDESWMFKYDPESKRQSCAWHTKSSPRTKKARMSKSRIKTMIIVFFDIRGIVHCEFVPQGQTVNSAFYLEVLKRLKRQIARVRTDIKDTVKLHHDNATSHTAFIITNFLARSNTPTQERDERKTLGNRGKHPTPCYNVPEKHSCRGVSGPVIELQQQQQKPLLRTSRPIQDSPVYRAMQRLAALLYALAACEIFILLEAAPATPEASHPASSNLADDPDKRAWNELSNMWGKRNWNNLHSVWGKRADGQTGWNSLSGAWGKRDWNNLKGVWGKRDNDNKARKDWDDLNTGWGRRDLNALYGSLGKRDWNNLSGMWGKRDWNNLSGMWGKRDWNNLSGMWGKRDWNNLSGMWGKRDLNNMNGVQDKPDWHNLSGMWGKRADWNNLSGMWGKRERTDSSYSGTWDKKTPNWNNLRGLWGKRSPSEDAWTSLAEAVLDLSNGPTPAIRRSCDCAHVRISSKGLHVRNDLKLQAKSEEMIALTEIFTENRNGFVVKL